MRLPFYITPRGKLIEGHRWSDLVERIKQRIMAAEDQAIFAALENAAKCSSDIDDA